MPEHVNRMDKSIKRHIIVEHMDEPSKVVLKEFLLNHDKGMWERSSQQLKVRFDRIKVIGKTSL